MPTSSTKNRLGEFFRSRLDMPEIHFFQNNADADSPPPYGVVTVTEMFETTPMANVFKAEVKIAVITSIDMSSSEEHDVLLEKVYGKLNNIPRREIDSANQIRVFGWTITSSETVNKDESQSMSDVITISVGCGG